MQHAANPVDWYPWSDEAFAAASREDKPILLSIGYSTCHWCHVMAHESFEDPAIADLMNGKFINIKVDREERPDIDLVYMEVCQRITGSGGWPLTVFMTPDKKPFFAGTYFPPENRHGRIGMRDLLTRISDLWKTRREDLLASADQLVALLKKDSSPSSETLSRESLLQAALAEFKDAYDQSHGGFGHAPKFPTPQNILFLLRCWKRFHDDEALQMAEKTLQCMRQGGIFDHLGYGIHRYSTDEKWLLPHFEKMLYDQAMVSIACIETFQATGKDEYARMAGEIFSYVLSDLKSPEGGFYSAEDADSEGEEGRFYLWTRDEVEQILTPGEAAAWNTLFSVDKNGNFLDEATRKRNGRNIFHRERSLKEYAAQLDIPYNELLLLIETSRRKLLAARRTRVKPLLDDKILTDWNGLMIAALALGARTLREAQYELAARSAADFILGSMLDDSKRLLHTCSHGTASVPAFLDDYAFIIWGLIELYQSCFDEKYLEMAIELNSTLLKHFWDTDQGGFFFTADYHEKLPFRKKPLYDGAIPSGNSVAALNLLRLARITGDSALESKVEIIGKASAVLIDRIPSSYAFYMTVIDYLLGPSLEIVITGERHAQSTRELLPALSGRFHPCMSLLLIPEGEKDSRIKALAPFTSEFKAQKDKTTVYICSGNVCRKPTTGIAETLQLLESIEAM